VGRSATSASDAPSGRGALPGVQDTRTAAARAPSCTPPPRSRDPV